MMRRRLVVMAVLLAACSGSKSTEGDAKAEDSKAESKTTKTGEAKAEVPDLGNEPLHNGQPSLEALGKGIVEALNANDAKAMLALSVTEGEFKQRLFGALITHPNALRFGPDLAWTNQQGDSLPGMKRALSEHGGKGYSFVALESTTQEDRPGLVVHRKPTLRVADAEGKEQELTFVKVVVEHPASGTFAILVFDG